MRRSIFLALFPLAMVGCGGGLKEFPTAKVSGKVLCDGKPVANVLVNFAPVGTGSAEVGKMGVGSAKDDGTFIVSTYGNEDGAVVGKHKVSVDIPHPEDFPNFTCNCETMGNKKPVQEVEVSAKGENNFTINLPPKTQWTRPSVDKEDLEDAKQSAAATKGKS